MSKRIKGIIFCIAGLLFVTALFIHFHAVIRQTETNLLAVPTEILVENMDLLAVQGEQEESEASMEEGEWMGDAENDVAAVCEMMRAMDFTVEQPQMGLTEEEDWAYKEAFLRLLKNELPVKGWNEGEDCYQDLWWAGIPYEFAELQIVAWTLIKNRLPLLSYK